MKMKKLLKKKSLFQFISYLLLTFRKAYSLCFPHIFVSYFICLFQTKMHEYTYKIRVYPKELKSKFVSTKKEITRHIHVQ